MVYMVIFTISALTVLSANFYLSKTKQQIDSSMIENDYPFKMPITLLVMVILSLTTALYLFTPRPQPMNIGSFPDPKNKDSDNLSKDNELSQSDSYDEKQSSSGEEQFSYEGFKDELSIDKKSSPSIANQLILYMKGEEPQYLRGNVYDHFDGRSWKGSASIFTPPSTVEMQFPANVIGVDNDGALFSRNSIAKDTFYSLNIPNSGNTFNQRPLEKTFDLSQTDEKRYLQLPKNLSPRFAEFSEKISNGSSTNQEKADRIEDYLRKNYEYSFDSIFNSQGVIPLEEFLFDKPQGHCEYFATAIRLD